jgi:hypothetical protein
LRLKILSNASSMKLNAYGDGMSERELERALIARIEDFLRAMGGMFAFMGCQYRLEVDQREYFIERAYDVQAQKIAHVRKEIHFRVRPSTVPVTDGDNFFRGEQNGRKMYWMRS